ncbi:hypothetical protein HDU67_006441 [Dinochytrium kinnereticum]|nr:hypothetical protein HDU67_006441 [Dinochytrium kinnereticum]
MATPSRESTGIPPLAPILSPISGSRRHSTNSTELKSQLMQDLDRHDRAILEFERGIAERRARFSAALAAADKELERDMERFRSERMAEKLELEMRLKEVEEEVERQRRESQRRRSMEALHRIGSSSSISSMRSDTSTGKSPIVVKEPSKASFDSPIRPSGSLFGVSTLLSSRRSSREFSDERLDEGDLAVQQFQEEQRQKRLSRQKKHEEVISSSSSCDDIRLNEERIDSAAALSSGAGSRSDGLNAGRFATPLPTYSRGSRLHVDADEVQECQAKEHLTFDATSGGAGSSDHEFYLPPAKDESHESVERGSMVRSRDDGSGKDSTKTTISNSQRIYHDSWRRFGNQASGEDYDGSLGTTASGSERRLRNDQQRFGIRLNHHFHAEADHIGSTNHTIAPPSTISGAGSSAQGSVASISEVDISIAAPLTPLTTTESTPSTSTSGTVNTREDLFYTSNRNEIAETPIFLLSDGRRNISDFQDEVYPAILRPNQLLNSVGQQRNDQFTVEPQKADNQRHELCKDEIPGSTDLDDLEDVPGKEKPLEKLTDDSQESSTPDSSLRSSSPLKDSDHSNLHGSDGSLRKGADDLTWDEAAVTADKIIPILAQIDPATPPTISTDDRHPMIASRSSAVSEAPVMTLDDLIDSPILHTRRIDDSANDDSGERNSLTSVASSNDPQALNAEMDGVLWDIKDQPGENCTTPTLRNRQSVSNAPVAQSNVIEEVTIVIPTESDATRPNNAEPARTSADSGSMNLMSNSSTLTTTVAIDYHTSKGGGFTPEPKSLERQDDSTVSQAPTSPLLSKSRSILERVLPSWRGPSSRRNSVSTPSLPDVSESTPPIGGNKWSSRSLSPTKSAIGGSVRDLIARAEKRDTPDVAASKRVVSSPLPLSDSQTKGASGRLKTMLSNSTHQRAVSASLPTSSPTKIIPSASIQRETALYRLKGKRRMYFSRVPFSVSSINSSDVFILEVAAQPVPPSPVRGGSGAGLGTGMLYVWVGAGAGKVKKAKALEVANRIRDKELRRKADIEIIDEEDESRRHLEFWQLIDPALSSIPKAVSKVAEDGDDIEFERKMDASLVLYGLREESEEFSVVAPSGKSLTSRLMNSGGVFILEFKSVAIYLWNGRHSSEVDRALGAQYAQQLCQPVSEEKAIPVYLERDAGESVFFMELFPDWSDGVTIEVKAPRNVQVKDKSRYVYDRGGFSRPAVTRLDVSKMLRPPPPPASWERQADGATLEDPGGPLPLHADLGKMMLNVFVAAGSELVALPDSEYGYLYSGDAYIFHYRHLKGREGNEKESLIVYSWVGDLSKGTEQATVAYNAAQMEKSYGCRHIRISEGHEPPHFLSIFKPSLSDSDKKNTYSLVIIKRGPRTITSPKDRALFHICSMSSDTLRAVETKWKASSLYRGSCFVACLKDRVYAWSGSGCFEFERDYARQVAAKVSNGRNIEVIEEGKEPSHFWQKLAGKDGVKNDESDYGSAEEVSPFAQSDLNQNSIYLLDAFFELYVWVGSEARSNYKDIRLALQTALDYAEHAAKEQKSRKLADGISAGSGVWLVRSGEETYGFKACFVAFDDGLDEYPGGFLDIIKRTGSLKAKKRLKPKAESVAALLEKMESSIYSLDELRKKDDIPLGVDPAHLEQETFKKYPAWKQSEMKKKGIRATLENINVLIADLF